MTKKNISEGISIQSKGSVFDTLVKYDDKKIGYIQCLNLHIRPDTMLPIAQLDVITKDIDITGVAEIFTEVYSKEDEKVIVSNNIDYKKVNVKYEDCKLIVKDISYNDDIIISGIVNIQCMFDSVSKAAKIVILKREVDEKYDGAE